MNRVPFNTKLSEVTGRRRRRARAEFEKARRSLVLMQCDLKMMHFFVFLCVFSGYAQVLFLRRMWIVYGN